MGPILKNFLLIFVLFIVSIVTAKAEGEVEENVDYPQQYDQDAENYRSPAFSDPEESLDYALQNSKPVQYNSAIEPLDPDNDMGENQLESDVMPEADE